MNEIVYELARAAALEKVAMMLPPMTPEQQTQIKAVYDEMKKRPQDFSMYGTGGALMRSQPRPQMTLGGPSFQQSAARQGITFGKDGPQKMASFAPAPQGPPRGALTTVQYQRPRTFMDHVTGRTPVTGTPTFLDRLSGRYNPNATSDMLKQKGYKNKAILGLGRVSDVLNNASGDTMGIQF